MKSKVLELIRSNPDGIDAESALSIISDQLNIDKDHSQTIINDLLMNKTLQIININNSPRYQTTKNQNYKWPETFIKIGPPQSIQSMEILNKTISSYPDEIIIVIDVTSPKVFGGLENRLRNKLKTIVVFPPDKEVESERKENYKTRVKEWKTLYRNFKNFKALTLLRSNIVNKSIRTSMLTNQFARINIRDINSKTTRNGLIIEVDSNNTLYNQFSTEIYRHIKFATPFISLNPLSYLHKVLMLPAITITLFIVAILFISSQKDILLFISCISCGVIGNIVYAKYDNIKNHR